MFFKILHKKIVLNLKNESALLEYGYLRTSNIQNLVFRLEIKFV